MAHLNFTDFYQVPDLKFDISKLRESLGIVLNEKGFVIAFVIVVVIVFYYSVVL